MSYSGPVVVPYSPMIASGSLPPLSGSPPGPSSPYGSPIKKKGKPDQNAPYPVDDLIRIIQDLGIKHAALHDQIKSAKGRCRINDSHIPIDTSPDALENLNMAQFYQRVQTELPSLENLRKVTRQTHLAQEDGDRLLSLFTSILTQCLNTNRFLKEVAELNGLESTTKDSIMRGIMECQNTVTLKLMVQFHSPFVPLQRV